MSYTALLYSPIIRLVLASEPFNETLETWKAKNSQLDLKVVKKILTQITKGLVFYHSHNLVHGNLSLSQIAIFDDVNSGEMTAKIFKFPILNDGNYSVVDFTT